MGSTPMHNTRQSCEQSSARQRLRYSTTSRAKMGVQASWWRLLRVRRRVTGVVGEDKKHRAVAVLDPVTRRCSYPLIFYAVLRVVPTKNVYVRLRHRRVRNRVFEHSIPTTLVVEPIECEVNTSRLHSALPSAGTHIVVLVGFVVVYFISRHP